MTSKKKNHLATVPSGPAPTVTHVEAVAAHGYLPLHLLEAHHTPPPRSAIVHVHRGEEVYYGLVQDEDLETELVSDAELAEMADDDIDDIEDDAASELALGFATLAGTPLDLPPSEAFRVLTAVQRAVYALRSAHLKGGEPDIHRVDLLRATPPAVTAAANQE